MKLQRLKKPLKFVSQFLLFSFLIFWLLFTTAFVNLYISPRIGELCNFRFRKDDGNNSTKLDADPIFRQECENQRLATILFLIFCLLRLVSTKVEAFIGTKIMKTCSIRSTFPGRHFGAALGFPFLTRSLSISIRVTSAPILLVIIFASTSIAFYPYVKDFSKLASLTYNAIQRHHYLHNRSLICALICLYLYFSTIFIEILDVSFGVYCPQTILGLPILFPNVNFPFFLFLLHTTILHHHKAMPAIIYEVNNEDCFIQLNRLRCITNKDCPQMSTAFPLDAVPSRTTTFQRRSFDGRIILVRDIRELDDILPCKISSHVRKVSMCANSSASMTVPVVIEPVSSVVDLG